MAVIAEAIPNAISASSINMGRAFRKWRPIIKKIKTIPEKPIVIRVIGLKLSFIGIDTSDSVSRQSFQHFKRKQAIHISFNQYKAYLL